jgi:DNA repair protein RecN (Recombination protein N)
MARGAMLRELSIRNLAVIEQVTVPFGPGLNVLTGETGAGKSILVDALLLVIGARAQADLIRSGEDSAVVQAVFDVDGAGPVAAVLEAAGHGASDGELIVKREISRAGRHRVFVNDEPATAGLLERLGGVLIELHGQHEHQQLSEPARQLDLLDRFGECAARRECVAALVQEWEAARDRLDQLEAEMRERVHQEDLYRFQLSEIDAVDPQPGEEEELRVERSRLQHAERIAAGLAEGLALLHEDDHSAVSRVGRAETVLRALAKLDPDTCAPLESLEGARAHLEEAVGHIRALRDRAVLDPVRLEWLDGRLDAIGRLKRKYGEDAAAIAAHRREIAAALERLERHEVLALELGRAVESAAAAARAEARLLSEARGRAAERFERLLQREVRGLGMAECRIRVALHRDVAGAGQLDGGGDGWRIGPRGAERAELLLSANPGEDLRSLAKVASGGELARTMLAVKTILAAQDLVPTLVFDEVDAGIGGRVADVIGQKLRQAAAGRQVLCVTHLAPIAAHTAHHLVVEKRVVRGATRTSVRLLDEAGRVEELARMLGGEHLTDASRHHARELLKSAQATAAA